MLIIGGAGLLGTRLAPKLRTLGHEVALCDNFSGSLKYRTPSDYRLFVANAADQNVMQHVFRVFEPEIVVLALAYVFPREVVYSPYEDSRLVVESANVLASLLCRGVKQAYFFSNGEVYGAPQSRRPLKEGRKIVRSATFHGAAKYAAEVLLSFRCQELGLPLTILRVFDMFGPRIVFSARTDVVNFLIDGFLRGEWMGLVGARRARDFVHVDDVVDAFLGLLEVGFAGSVNIGTGRGTSLRQVSSALCELMGISDHPEEVPDFRETFSAVASTELLDSVVSGGWSPKYDIITELPAMVEFRRQENELRRHPNLAKLLVATKGAG